MIRIRVNQSRPVSCTVIGWIGEPAVLCHIYMTAPRHTHTDSKNGNYVRLLFLDCSSAFNTIVPINLTDKLTDLGLNSSRFPHRQTSSGESRPVHLQLHHPEHRSPTGLCPESPALLSLYTHDCVSSHSSTLLLNLLMILWFWASLPTMMRQHTWMR